MIVTNAVVLSVLILAILSLLKLPVFFALLIAAIVAGISGGLSLTDTMSLFVDGMGENANTALSYILLGALAYTINKSGAAAVMSRAIANVVKGHKLLLALIIVLVSIASQTIVPVHIAFIPILIPPLLALMNDMKMDRRMAAIAFAFGLKATYIMVPFGFGGIFQGVVKDSVNSAGLNVALSDIWKYVWPIGLAMGIGMVIGLLVFAKDRDYDPKLTHQAGLVGKFHHSPSHIKRDHWMTLLAGILTLLVQLVTGSLPLGALLALIFLVMTRVVDWDETQEMIQGGIDLMGYIAFVMLIATGYSNVINNTGAIDQLVTSTVSIIGGSQWLGASLMVLLGLLITLGVGSSFGTIPIIAALYVPLAQELNFSLSATVLLIVAAGALGDAGSPASDTTLGPTAGLNADGQHDHIWDTVVPQFLCYNIPIILITIFAAIWMS